jgi:hypothetical protein
MEILRGQIMEIMGGVMEDQTSYEIFLYKENINCSADGTEEERENKL